MANATAAVKKGVSGYGAPSDFLIQSSVTLGSETTYYQNAMVGWTTAGYLTKFDDSASMIFAGVVAGDQGNQKLPAGTQGALELSLRIERPRYIELTVTSVAVTDIGKTVYADDDQTGVLATASTTYGNVVGIVVGVVATNIALVECAYDGIGANERLGAARRMAATGAQTLSAYDVGKKILVANTAALAITLPAVSDVPYGRGFTFVKDHASDTNAITVTSAGSDSIDASATLATLDAPFDCVTIIATNTNRWVATSRDIA